MSGTILMCARYTAIFPSKRGTTTLARQASGTTVTPATTTTTATTTATTTTTTILLLVAKITFIKITQKVADLSTTLVVDVSQGSPRDSLGDYDHHVRYYLYSRPSESWKTIQTELSGRLQFAKSPVVCVRDSRMTCVSNIVYMPA